jgi:hypothetical protein
MKTKIKLMRLALLVALTASVLTGMAQPYPNTGNQSVCLGATEPYGVINTPGSTYAWSIIPITGGNGTITGNGNSSISVTWNSVGTCTLQVIETLASGCVGLPVTIIVTVNPTPTVVPDPTAQTICSAGTTNINLTGTPVGVTFAWTAAVAPPGSITGSSAGSGALIAQTLTNTTTSPATVTYTITPSANGCDGLPVDVIVTVNPTATVNTVADVAYCNGATTAVIPFSGPVAGTTYAWTNSDPSIGLAASGTGDIPSFTATNAGTTPVVATITVTPTANGCVGTPTTFTITVNPTSTVNPVADVAYCNGATTAVIPFTSPVSGTTFAWTNSDPSIGLAASGTGDIPSFTAINNGTAPVVATITVTPSANGCTGTPSTFTITVNPAPTVNPVANVAYCNGATTAVIPFSSPVSGTTFTWTNSDPSIGLAASGTGDIPSFTATNAGSAPVVATITVTPSASTCPGVPLTFTITVNPTATVNPVANVAYCNGATTAVIPFTSPVSGATYAWTNSDPSIGLGASGTGDIPSFTATNLGSAPVIATITVTPTANGCVGTPTTFTITVNPSPTVNPVTDAVYCNGATTAVIPFTSPVAGTTFTWTNSDPSIGLGASGTGDIPSFTATNAGSAPVVATITVTPSANTCAGVPLTFTITVNPTATVNPVADVAYCNGVATAVIPLSSPVAGATFAWTNSNPSIGLAASGTGDIPSFTATNAGTTPVVATITVTPTASSCVGTPITFTITVNPTPTVDPLDNLTYCAGATTSPVPITGPVAGTTFTWTNSDPSIGLAASGTGDIPSFVAVNPGPGPIVATITVTPTANGCVGTPVTFTITINPRPVPTIAGPTPVCLNSTGNVYTTEAGMTNYTWTITGGTIDSGQGTNSISVTWTAVGNQTLTVTYTNTNGCTPVVPTTFTVVVNQLPNTSPIYHN